MMLISTHRSDNVDFFNESLKTGTTFQTGQFCNQFRRLNESRAKQYFITSAKPVRMEPTLACAEMIDQRRFQISDTTDLCDEDQCQTMKGSTMIANDLRSNSKPICIKSM